MSDTDNLIQALVERIHILEEFIEQASYDYGSDEERADELLGHSRWGEDELR